MKLFFLCLLIPYNTTIFIKSRTEDLAINHGQCKPTAKFQSCCNIHISMLDHSDFVSVKRYKCNIIMGYNI